MENRLYRSRKDKIIGGVCGGIGEYLRIDPVIIRLLIAITAIIKGVGFLAYIIAWIIIPNRPIDLAYDETDYTKSSWTKYLPGLIMIMIGLILLVRINWFWFDFDEIWPVLLIVFGLYLIMRGSNKLKKNSHIYSNSNNIDSSQEGKF